MTFTSVRKSRASTKRERPGKARGQKGQTRQRSTRRNRSEAPEADFKDWPEWVQHLDQRRSPAPLMAVWPPAGRFPLHWGAGQATADSVVVPPLEQLASGRDKRSSTHWVQLLDDWLRGQPHGCGIQRALESLAWCHVLPQLAALLPEAEWRRLYDQLLQDISSAQQSTHPLISQLLAGELPLTLAYLFPELPECYGLAAAARQWLNESVLELLDGAGMLAAENLPWQRMLLGCWVRCEYLGRAEQRPCFARRAFTQLQWLAQQALRLSRSDGSLIFSREGTDDGPLWAAALPLLDDPQTSLLAARLFPRQRQHAAPVSELDLPPPSAYSEWASVAVLRTSWSRGAAQLALAWQQGRLHSELNCGGVRLWSGACMPEVRVDGQVLAVESDWEEICWFSDDDVDYLELEAKLAAGWSIQRQWCLARDGDFVYIADSVLGPRDAQIEYRCTWPLSQQVCLEPEQETNECLLTVRQPVALVLPLALPEWRAEHSSGQLIQRAEGLTLCQATHGQRLYAPLFVSLQRRRLRSPRTWRRLTIGQELEIVPPEVAVGYRVQVADQQWLIYRSLAPCANRTVLGQNTANEFLLARFDRNGEIDELVEVEMSE